MARKVDPQSNNTVSITVPNTMYDMSNKIPQIGDNAGNIKHAPLAQPWPERLAYIQDVGSSNLSGGTNFGTIV